MNTLLRIHHVPDPAVDALLTEPTAARREARHAAERIAALPAIPAPKLIEVLLLDLSLAAGAVRRERGETRRVLRAQLTLLRRLCDGLLLAWEQGESAREYRERVGELKAAGRALGVMVRALETARKEAAR